MRKAVFAGSFDPLTMGHVDIIRRASKLFDELVVLINYNPDKNEYIQIIDRVSSVKDEFSNDESVSVDVSRDQYTVDYCKDNDIGYIVRGVRNSQDFLYEDNVSNINKQLDPNVETVLLFTDKNLSVVSSSTVKGLCGFKGWEQRIEKFLPRYSYALVLEKEDALKKEYIKSIEILTGDGEVYKNPSIQLLYYNILRAYSIRNRHYHSIIHIVNGLNTMKQFKLNDEQKALLTIAYLYHDLVYDTNQDDVENVFDSENKFKKHFENILSKSQIKIIKNLILATAHKKEPYTFLERCICDIDLVIFASDINTYMRASFLIRKEYSQYDDVTWNKGRKDFLNKMYVKENFFHELPNNDTIEKQAKENILFELNLINPVQFK